MFSQKEERLRLIINNTYKSLYNFLFRLCKDTHDTDEILQNVYIKIWQNLDNIKDDEKILPLLKHYSKNIFLNELKKNQRIKNSLAELLYDKLESSAEDAMIQKENFYEITSAIKKLSQQQQQIFKMHKEEAMSYKQIAERLGLSIGTIEQQMHRALKFLRLELQHYYNETSTTVMILFFLKLMQIV